MCMACARAQARRKLEAEHVAAVESARAAGDPEPPLPAELAGDLCVKFLHYPEVHPNVDSALT